MSFYHCCLILCQYALAVSLLYALATGCESHTTVEDIEDTGSNASASGDIDTNTHLNTDTNSENGNTSISDAGHEDLAPTKQVSSISHHGITWTFSVPVAAGQFITGDWFVIGPVTVTDIDPPPEDGRNGSVVNLPPTQSRSGWDNRVEENRYDASLRNAPPIELQAGDTLLSSISVETPGEVYNWLRDQNEKSLSPVWSISVLTCLNEAPVADAFRPSYSDPEQRIYRQSDIDLTSIGSLALPQGTTVETSTLEEFATRFIRPWVDNLSFGFDAQVEYMPMYGREMGRAAGIASLMLLVDLPEEQKDIQERLLIGFVQHGIDLWGLVRAGYPGWSAHGGHGSGRKWFIMFSGLLLSDEEMAEPTVTYPKLKMGEDMQTAYVSDVPDSAPVWWDQSEVVYTGHTGLWNNEVVSSDPGWGPYEHLPPDEWASDTGESYRRCCTSLAWVGEALAARLMNAMDHWAHPAFFDYVDRWMNPGDDNEYTATILEMTGWDFTPDWAAHGQAWDDLVEEMWTEYR